MVAEEADGDGVRCWSRVEPSVSTADALDVARLRPGLDYSLNMLFTQRERLMDLDTYRRDVRRTVRPELSQHERLLIGGLGLASEAGEVANALNHQLHFGHPPDPDRLRDELGDVLWYLVFLCDTLDLSLEDVMAANADKRRQRYPDGFNTERSMNREE